MGFQLLIPGSELVTPRTPSRDKIEAVARAQARVTKPRADATHRTYEAARERYAEFCDDFGVEPFPLTPLQLTSFLDWYSSLINRYGERTAPSSVRVAMSALCTLDRWQRVTPSDPNPVTMASAPEVQAWLSNWEREHPARPQKRAPIVQRAQLLRILDTLQKPTPGAALQSYATRAARDTALWLVGIGAALRVDELARLRTEHVERVDQGLFLSLPKSKANQRGELDERGIEFARTLELCPVRAWDRWMHERGDWRGPVFVGIQRNGQISGEALEKRSLQRILTESAARAEVKVSAHSLRRTFATRSRAAGHKEDRIQRQGGWLRADSVRRYFSIENVWDDNPTRGLFDETER